MRKDGKHNYIGIILDKTKHELLELHVHNRTTKPTSFPDTINNV